MFAYGVVYSFCIVTFTHALNMIWQELAQQVKPSASSFRLCRGINIPSEAQQIIMQDLKDLDKTVSKTRSVMSFDWFWNSSIISSDYTTQSLNYLSM